MKHILKREYTAEFKEQAVAMVNNGRSVRRRGRARNS
jgi:transposase-like protein